MLDYDPKLKEAAAEIRSICRKFDIAAYVVLVSPTHSEFVLEVEPSWSATHWENAENGNPALRFRVKSAEVGKDKAQRLVDLTCHMIYQMRDLCALGFKFTESMIRLVETQVDVDHKPFSNFKPHRDQ